MAFSKLTPLQREVLEAIFAREQRVFLTGGAALAEYHLGHRTTDDLDIFTCDVEAFQAARHVLASVAEALGATLETKQSAPGFRRDTIVRSDGAVVVDTVHERAAEPAATKLHIGSVLVDPPAEILENKLTTIVGRMEERDLVDVFFLERAGFRVEDALPGALEKDGGCTPATLAWLLSEIDIPDGARLSAGLAPSELRTYLAELVVRLRRLALPAAID